MVAHAFALVGRSYPSEQFALLYAASQASRDRRRALMRSADGRARRAASFGATGERWRKARGPVSLPRRLGG